MTMTAVLSPIVTDEEGVAWIEGTRTKVLDKIAWGKTPEEIREAYPYLSLSQVYAALSYYYAHQEIIDADIERRYQEAQRLKTSAGLTALQKRLQAEGKI